MRLAMYLSVNELVYEEYYLLANRVLRVWVVKSVVLKVSGKIINPDNPQLVSGYARVIKRLVDEGNRFVIVVGGGSYARKYVECARSLGLGEGVADSLGIEVSRVNALLLSYALGDYAYRPIPRSIEDVEEAWSSGKVVVLGGLQPGQSTSGTAAVVAEVLGIKLMLYATDVDGIYDRDPKRYPNAKRLDVVRISDLPKVLEQGFEAGRYELLDPVAMGVLKRAGIEVVVFNGFDPENVEKALRGAIGTRVVPE